MFHYNKTEKKTPSYTPLWTFRYRRCSQTGFAQTHAFDPTSESVWGCAYHHKHPAIHYLSKSQLLLPVFCLQRSLRSQSFSLGAPGPKLADSSLTLSSLCLNPQPASASANCLPVPSLTPVRTEACFHPSPPPAPHTHRTVHYSTHFKFPPIQGQLRKKKSS